MTPEILKSFLVDATKKLGWQADEVAEFTSPDFRSRPAQPDVKSLDGLFGLRLGDYPVVIAPIMLESPDQVKLSLKKLHAQMVVARSFMREREVINAHLFLCATSPTPSGDWKRLVDLLERDETVCRKVVWIPKKTDVQGSFETFLGRTFLAMPWASSDSVTGAPLDETYELAERILEKHGLEKKVAEQWVIKADQLKDDAKSLVTELVQAREASR
ncbi:hypothetical protein HJB56_07605 [Rhizobium lentis]|uniref:Uncharacterized protein n=1 Tax=Rhizobium binae TaxID=1138190 RepID=A0ABV2MS96_9HYPH|nr:MULTISPECIES: ABC-three component system middle component 1 [Rhizobium]NKL52757.1 hypothetical protein [Rhizobium leguminosarum bv. viciae]MBX4927149.1 hypothetical protein [Rhizobium binae]MBX4996122.1 hypothetical protein [Rhizobium binae]MBX5082634.1 hypothetical protein [Rhizobium lentis]MBX5096225.1 hypothetical protein [Rhizobium lentis]